MRTKVDMTPYQDTDEKWSYLNLEKFYGKKIAKVLGYIGGDGFFAFGLSRIVFEDGTDLHVEGSHDFAYVYGGSYGKSAEPPFDMDALDDGEPVDYPGEDEDEIYLDDGED